MFDYQRNSAAPNCSPLIWIAGKLRSSPFVQHWIAKLIKIAMRGSLWIVSVQGMFEYHSICWWEKLQETPMIFMGKSMVSCRFSLKSTQREYLWIPLLIYTRIENLRPKKRRWTSVRVSHQGTCSGRWTYHDLILIPQAIAVGYTFTYMYICICIYYIYIFIYTCIYIYICFLCFLASDSSPARRS